jgi:hypothetical protein
MKNREIYVMAKSTATLTQSGLLAVLLQRQRQKGIELAQRCGHSKQMRSAFSSVLTWSWRELTAPLLIDDSAVALEEPFPRRI